VADATLSDAQEFRDFCLRQPMRGDRLLELNQQVGADQQMRGLIG
jgi:hypothetical protein